MKDIFLITSVINTGDIPWTYGPRSVFTPEQRLEQTINTISSIRSKVDAYIILVECSDISEETTCRLEQLVDCFIQTFNNLNVRETCINSNIKGYGELRQILVAIDYIKEHSIPFRRFFKISGRYYLDDNFNIESFSDTVYSGAYYNYNLITVLYSVPSSLMSSFVNVLLECDNIYLNNQACPLETLMASRITPIHVVDALGVAGLVAVNNTFWSSAIFCTP